MCEIASASSERWYVKIGQRSGHAKMNHTWLRCYSDCSSCLSGWSEALVGLLYRVGCSPQHSYRNAQSVVQNYSHQGSNLLLRCTADTTLTGIAMKSRCARSARVLSVWCFWTLMLRLASTCAEESSGEQAVKSGYLLSDSLETGGQYTY